MFYRGDSCEFEVIKEIDLAQAVPGEEISTSYLQEINFNTSFYDVSRIPTTCMNVDDTEADVEMPSAVRSVTSDSCAAKRGHSDTNSESTADRVGIENMGGAYGDDRLDSLVMEATSRSLETGSLMPLIKEELKLSIQSKRLKEGKEELKVDFSTPAPYMLTEEEIEKVKRRRTQNREAAQRFRSRQKSKGSILQKECEKLEGMNTRLRFVASQLKTERDKLRSSLEAHLRVCPYQPPQPFYKSNFPGNNVDQR